MPTTDVKVQSALGSDYGPRVTALLDGAKSSVRVLMYEWKWYSHESAGGVRDFNLALVRALRRGVKVRVILNSEDLSHPLTRINGRTGSFLRKAGAEVKTGHLGSTTHAKVLIIDDEILVLGSHNISKSAFTRNFEASIIIHSRQSILDFIRYFENIWKFA